MTFQFEPFACAADSFVSIFGSPYGLLKTDLFAGL